MSLLTICAIAVATVLFLMVDIYPVVPSFFAIIKTPSFWLLCVIVAFLNLIGLGALQAAIGDKVSKWVSGELPAALMLILLATLGTITIIQSFTLKIADLKLVDLGVLVDKYRKAVLEAVGKKMAVLRGQEEKCVALKIARKFQGNEQALRQHYLLTFSFGGTTNQQIADEINELQRDARTLGCALEDLLAQRIAQADLLYAKTLA